MGKFFRFYAKDKNKENNNDELLEGLTNVLLKTYGLFFIALIFIGITMKIFGYL